MAAALRQKTRALFGVGLLFVCGVGAQAAELPDIERYLMLENESNPSAQLAYVEWLLLQEDESSAQRLTEQLLAKDPSDALQRYLQSLWRNYRLLHPQHAADALRVQLSLRAGYDSNYLQTTSHDQITLRLNDLPFFVPIEQRFRAREVAYQQLGVQLFYQSPDPKTPWQATLLLDQDRTPDETPTKNNQFAAVNWQWAGGYRGRASWLRQSNDYLGQVSQYTLGVDKSLSAVARLGLEWQTQRYDVSSLDGQGVNIVGEYLTGWGLWQLKLGQDMALQAERAGGDQLKTSLGWWQQFRLGQTITLTTSYLLSHSHDSQVYSAIMQPAAVRQQWQQRLMLVGQGPLAERLDWQLGLGYWQQQSNLPLFEAEGSQYWLGLLWKM